MTPSGSIPSGPPWSLSLELLKKVEQKVSITDLESIYQHALITTKEMKVLRMNYLTHVSKANTHSLHVHSHQKVDVTLVNTNKPLTKKKNPPI